ncbi:NgoFVII family restriction endonuclease, partial [Patescibacteria group bacterium]|nr:NgoFVII family restriction endonuclease [Patescibacteria group bacterium]
SKVFTWFNSGKPQEAYSGSANYSQYGFFEDKQRNQMVSDNSIEIKNFFDDLLSSSIFMPHAEIDNSAVFYRVQKVHGSVPAGGVEWIELGKTVRISFLDKKGMLPPVSGLNWGQRKEKRINKGTGEVKYVLREKNQAYLSLKGDVREEGFLPKMAYNFTLLTDDNASFDCVVAQEGRKAIHSTNDNSELGRYFRKRLGLEPGAFVTVEDLERYGRTDYTLSKIDDENFLLDFSVKPN